MRSSNNRQDYAQRKRFVNGDCLDGNWTSFVHGISTQFNQLSCSYIVNVKELKIHIEDLYGGSDNYIQFS